MIQPCRPIGTHEKVAGFPQLPTATVVANNVVWQRLRAAPDAERRLSSPCLFINTGLGQDPVLIPGPSQFVAFALWRRERDDFLSQWFIIESNSDSSIAIDSLLFGAWTRIVFATAALARFFFARDILTGL